MRIRWRDLELPNRLECEDETLTETYGKFFIEPFERGFGTTVGNSLRRVLLSSLEGAAVTHVRIKGVEHEFSTIPGIYEDVSDIILNVKGLRFKVHTDEPVTLTLNVSKEGDVTAGDFQETTNVEVVNKDARVATLVEQVDFEMQVDVTKGRGYRPSDENFNEGHEIGTIPVDSIFTPVVRVKYDTTDTRVGKLTNYDRLIMEIWTDGSISPEMALVSAAKILRKHLNPFVQYFEVGKELQQDKVREDREARQKKYIDELRKKLEMDVSILDLSVRASNCIEQSDIKALGDLVVRNESELLKMRNFGKTSLNEIKKKLGKFDLSLGMDVELILSEPPEMAE